MGSGWLQLTFKPLFVHSRFKSPGAAGAPAAKAVIGSTPNTIHRGKQQRRQFPFLLAFGFSSLLNKIAYPLVDTKG